MIANSRTLFFCFVVCEAIAAGGCQQEAQKPPAAQARKAEPAKPSWAPGRHPAEPRSAKPAADAAARDDESAESSTAGPSSDGKSASASSPAGESASPSGIGAEFGQIDPADLVMPKVLLTNGHAKTCRVGVGDPMPDISLPDVGGRKQSLADLLGERLTVVTFWTAANPYALAELADLGPEIADRFGKRGVNVVGINERDAPDVVRETVEKLDARFPNLLDANGAALGAVATRKLPRTYLLDSSGKILWFDIEYSNTTRRELREAIQFVLNQG